MLQVFWENEGAVSSGMHALLSVESRLKDIERNLTALLNHKRIPAGLLGQQVSSDDPILAYGLPDLTHFNPDSDSDRRQVRQLLQEAIRRFEKRLENVSVILLEPPKEKRLALTMLHFQIRAEVRVQAQLAPVMFDSLVYPVQDQVVVEGRAL